MDTRLFPLSPVLFLEVVGENSIMVEGNSFAHRFLKNGG